MMDDNFITKTRVHFACVTIVLLSFGNTASTSESLARKIRAASDDVCNSTTCSELGHFLRASLNSSADPCEDFYAFACGGWVRRHKTIPESESYIDEWSKLKREKVVPAMMALFDGPNLDPKKMAHSVVLTQALYQDCVDLSKRNQLGWKPFQEKLKSLLGFAWPIENFTGLINLQNKEIVQEPIARFAAVGVEPFFRMKPIVDKLNPSRRIMVFSQPIFGFPRYVFANKTAPKNAEQFQAYRKFLKQAFRLIEQASVTAESQKMTESALNTRIDAVLDLETRLALLTLPEERAAAQRVDIWQNRMKYDQFKNLTQNFFDFQTHAALVASKVLNRSLTPEEQTEGLKWIVVPDKNYFPLMAILPFEISGSLIADYLALKFLFQYRSDGPSDLAQADFELKQVTYGLKSLPPVWEKCLENIQELLPLPAARLYVDAHVDPKTKELTKMIADSIKAEFEYLLKNNKAEWLDAESIEQGKRKLRRARFVIGYPPFLQNNTQLDRAFGLESGNNRKIAFKKGNYLETLLAVTSFTKGTEVTELWARKVNDSEIYALSPINVDAYALRFSNVTFIPIALLQPPFFDANLPAYLQLAGIGGTLGHELVHLFDDQNLRRKADGSPSPDQWWTDDADRKLKQQSNCFVYQYGNLTDKESGLRVNGQLTLRENIADNGGIRQAFYAFETLEKKEKKAGRKLPRLPHLSQYTPEQTFLIAHAQNFCVKIRPEAALSNVMTNPHAPSRYRLNVPLANLKQFSKVFQCKKGSAMRPEKRCRIW